MPHGYLLDMDGVLYRGNQAIEGAVPFITGLRDRSIPCICLTNHSRHRPEDLSARLLAMGIEIGPEAILTSGMALARHLGRSGIRRIFAVAETPLRELFTAAGLELTSDDPQAVAIGLDRRITWDTVTDLYRLLAAGLPYYATNPDISYPEAEGPAPEVGFLLAGLREFCGRDPIVMGKPSPMLFEMALERIGLKAGEVTMVGDRLDTDIAGAAALGLGTALVTTGSTRRDQLGEQSIRPDRVVDDLRELLPPA